MTTRHMYAINLFLLLSSMPSLRAHDLSEAENPTHVQSSRFADRVALDDEPIGDLTFVAMADYDVINSENEQDYVEICAAMPDVQPSRLRVLFNRFGSAILVRIMAVKRFFVERYDRFQEWRRVRVAAKVVQYERNR